MEKDVLSQSNVTRNSCSSLQTAFVVDEVSNIVKEVSGAVPPCKCLLRGFYECK